MTYSKQTWTDNVTTVDKSHMDHIEDGIVALDTGKVTFAYGTTLPASPVDGQIAILVDSLTNPSYQWMFRYNAGSTSAYKWEFIGGAPLGAFIAADEPLTADGSWRDATTVGPAVTVPRAGEYAVSAACGAYNSSAVAGAMIGVTIGAGTPVDPFMALINLTAINVTSWLSVVPSIGLVAAASDSIRARYVAGTGGAGAGHVNRRMLSVAPKRVS
jgi:hypothetical protein